ncbi:MAG: type II secretion system protein, partial [Lentisphaerae bacterium]|nr:type II secretion system protein [Lentisphaerota bacterium]
MTRLPNKFIEKGFTLLEMLVAIALLTIALAMAFSTFSAVSRAWERGNQLADNLGHGEFMIEQLSAGLRSAYFPASAGDKNIFGFILENYGDGEDARDSISWVKTGP